MNMTAISLKTGIMVVPMDHIPIEETMTEDSDYAGVIREVQGTIPHYVAFFDKPFSSYTSEEQKEILEKCAKLRPDIRRALNNEVDMIFDEEGRVLNAEEWRASVRVAIDPIPICNSYEALESGLAIARR